MTAAGSPRPRTTVYVDGFNLFHGCLKDGPYRWLDLAAFCRAVLPGDDIGCIGYFTAVITARPGHPNATQHQLTYLRALATIPHGTIDYGHFLTSRMRMKPVRSIKGHSTVEVWKTEEKGLRRQHRHTDALRRVRRGLRRRGRRFERLRPGAADSRDSAALPAPGRRHHPQIGSPDPVTGRYRRPTTSYALEQEASFYRPVRPSALAASQFPTRLIDAVGVITRPVGW